MDWNTIEAVGIAGLIFSINFLVLFHIFLNDKDLKDIPILRIVLSSLLSFCAGSLEVMLILGLLHLAGVLITWGLFNVLVLTGVLFLTVGLPLLAKPLLIKAVAVPHFVKLGLTRIRKEQIAYKTEVTEKFPIKRSVYELIDDK
jgi:hypothetical protein